MLVAEDLLLLLLDDVDGTMAAPASAQTVLGGAILSELALAGSVTVGERSGFWQTAKVRVVGPPPAPPEDPQLQAALAVVAEKERSAQDLVTRLGKDLEDVLAERLVQRGLLERREKKVLGLFRSTRWPAADTAYEQQVRQALVATLVQGVDPSPRTAALVALLHAVDQAHRVVGTDVLPAREITKRAERVAEGQWAPEGVADAIAATNAAVTAAIVASTVAATTTTTS